MSEDDAPESDPEAFHDRLDDVEQALESAATEDDLDAIEADLDGIEADLEEATFPKPPDTADEGDEDVPHPREELEDRIEDLRDSLDEQRGPYASDVIDEIEAAVSTIETTEWASEGEEELHEVVREFLDAVAETLDISIDPPGEEGLDHLTDALEESMSMTDEAELHPDSDTPSIEALLEASGSLTSGVESATAFGDLPVREQLHRKGFFNILGHYKDFPPEWSALKAHEEARNVDMILLAFDLLDSNFLEEHCVASLRRLGDPVALDPMMQLAQRRNKEAIEVLGKIAEDDPVDMLVDYIDTDSDPLLQQVSLKALGEIGHPDSTEAVAQQLLAEDERVRSAASRALGMIGDPRAVDPLAAVLADDEAEPVRGSAAWALVEIGTSDALESVREYREDGSFLVEQEASKAPA